MAHEIYTNRDVLAKYFTPIAFDLHGFGGSEGCAELMPVDLHERRFDR